MKKKLNQGVFYTKESKISSINIYTDDFGIVYVKVGAGRGTRYREIGKMTVFNNCYKYQIVPRGGHSMIEAGQLFDI